jgi:hypothetical protein
MQQAEAPTNVSVWIESAKDFFQCTFHGQISATMVRIIPATPFPSPARIRAVKAIEREVENPHNKLVIMVIVRLRRMTGLLPKWSLNILHGIAAIHSQAEYADTIIPAHRAMSFSATPKLSIISGRYGRMERRDKGSAKRHIAAKRRQQR